MSRSTGFFKKFLVPVVLMVGVVASVGFFLIARAFGPATEQKALPAPAPTLPTSTASGAELAEMHCSGCHLEPSPTQLPKHTWEFVLDWMANYLGYEKLDGELATVVDRERIPKTPVIDEEALKRLRAYFVSQAPKASDLKLDRDPTTTPLSGFAPRAFPATLPSDALMTLLHVGEDGTSYLGFGKRRLLRVYDPARQLLLESPLPSEPVHVEVRQDGFRLGLIGDFDKDTAGGAVADIQKQDGQMNLIPLVRGYHRLVEHHTADIDGDGLEDLLLVGFGDFSDGRVGILWGGSGSNREQILESRSGGVGARIVDFDADGDLDILLVMAQGRQEVVLHRKTGPRRFEREQLLERHSSWGYNDMTTADFDGDGYVDLVTANGNNMELAEPPLRPYHGVRVLQNREGKGLKERFSFALPGAMGVTTLDVDGDGQQEIAAVAFYPDWSSEPETFVLLKATGTWSFQPQTLGSEHFGRWIRVAAGDFDQDGDDDLLLGNGAIPAGLPASEAARWAARISQAPSVLWLENL